MLWSRARRSAAIAHRLAPSSASACCFGSELTRPWSEAREERRPHATASAGPESSRSFPLRPPPAIRRLRLPQTAVAAKPASSNGFGPAQALAPADKPGTHEPEYLLRLQ